MPFLLPMMLQLGFGMSAAQSGLVTFASSVGSLMMRCRARLLRRLGFRNVLVWVGLSRRCCWRLRRVPPVLADAAIYAVLLVGGFFQSLQFMAYNTIAYADVPRAAMSAATSFYTTFQQLCISLGIATAAAALAGSRAVLGHDTLTLPDFSLAFLVCSVFALGAPLISLKLDRNAGAEMSGHTVAPIDHPGRDPQRAPAPTPAPVSPRPARLEARRRTATLLERSS